MISPNLSTTLWKTQKSYPRLLQLVDFILDPLMRLISGAPLEAPQETHQWNLRVIPATYRDDIDETIGIRIEGSYKGIVGKEHAGGLFHFPIFGGWKEYVVLEADTAEPWYLGWILKGMRHPYFEISRLTLASPVRVLRPPVGTSVLFFGLSAGNQIPLKLVGDGTIGDGRFSRVRLL